MLRKLLLLVYGNGCVDFLYLLHKEEYITPELSDAWNVFYTWKSVNDAYLYKANHGRQVCRNYI